MNFISFRVFNRKIYSADAHVLIKIDAEAHRKKNSYQNENVGRTGFQHQGVKDFFLPTFKQRLCLFSFL